MEVSGQLHAPAALLTEKHSFVTVRGRLGPICGLNLKTKENISATIAGNRTQSSSPKSALSL